MIGGGVAIIGGGVAIIGGGGGGTNLRCTPIPLGSRNNGLTISPLS
jgi:hypothetical protein